MLLNEVGVALLWPPLWVSQGGEIHENGATKRVARSGPHCG